MEIIFSPALRQNGMDIGIGVLSVHGFQVLSSKYDLNPKIQTVQKSIRDRYTIENIKDQPIIAAYRAFYWKYLKIDPTKTRPASEALIRRIITGNALPLINLFVDIYNWASVESLISLSAYDLSKITFPLQIRFVSKNETFTPINSTPKLLPESALVVCDGSNKILCQYPYRDAHHSLVSSSSTDIMILSYGVNNIPKSSLLSALELIQFHLQSLKANGIIKYQCGEISVIEN